MTTERILAWGRKDRSADLTRMAQGLCFLVRDLEGSTIVTTVLPDPHQRKRREKAEVPPSLNTYAARAGVPSPVVVSRLSLEAAAVVTGNRAIFGADRVFAKHRI